MSDSIRWNPGVDRFDANPAATVALDRAAWERTGAVFLEQDDGDDERPGLAVGEIETVDGPLRFGVLDYGEDTTFLLVPGRDRAAVEAANALLRALQQAGVVDLATQLSDFSAGGGPSSSHVALEDRVDELEREMAMITQGAFALVSGEVPVLAEGQMAFLPDDPEDAQVRRRSNTVAWQNLINALSAWQALDRHAAAEALRSKPSDDRAA